MGVPLLIQDFDGLKKGQQQGRIAEEEREGKPDHHRRRQKGVCFKS